MNNSRLLTPEEITHICTCARSYIYKPALLAVEPQSINRMAQQVLNLLSHISALEVEQAEAMADLLAKLIALNASIPALQRGAFKRGVLWCQGWTRDPKTPPICDEATRRYPDAPSAPEAT